MKVGGTIRLAASLGAAAPPRNTRFRSTFGWVGKRRGAAGSACTEAVRGYARARSQKVSRFAGGGCAASEYSLSLDFRLGWQPRGAAGSACTSVVRGLARARSQKKAALLGAAVRLGILAFARHSFWEPRGAAGYQDEYEQGDRRGEQHEGQDRVRKRQFHGSGSFRLVRERA